MFYLLRLLALGVLCVPIFLFVNACYSVGPAILAVVVAFIPAALGILSMPNPDDPHYQDHPEEYKKDLEYYEYSTRWRLY